MSSKIGLQCTCNCKAALEDNCATIPQMSTIWVFVHFKSKIFDKRFWSLNNYSRCNYSGASVLHYLSLVAMRQIWENRN